jgi:hypothetical protein
MVGVGLRDGNGMGWDGMGIGIRLQSAYYFLCDLGTKAADREFEYDTRYGARSCRSLGLGRLLSWGRGSKDTVAFTVAYSRSFSG